MPSLLGTTVAANYLKTSPTTQFGTRALRIIQVTAGTAGNSDIDFTVQKFAVTGASTGAFTGSYTDSDSYFSAAVRAISSVAEIYAVGQPDATTFLAVVAAETANDSGTGANANIQDKSWSDLEAAITDTLARRLGNGTVTSSVGLVYDGTVAVTAIDTAAGISNFVGNAVNTRA